MKKKTLKQLKAEAWKVFSVYIRRRDCLKTTGSLEWGECITCDRPAIPFEELQAGHFIPGRHNANLFSERGVNAQCKSCNLLHHGRPLEYRRQIVKMYGEGADLELEAEARQVKKFSREELENMITEYKERILALS